MFMDEKYLKNVEKCPWCESSESILQYINKYDAKVVRCIKCGLVYSKKVLNSVGIQKYWENYESKVHNRDKELLNKRKIMYSLDFNFIKPFIKEGNKVLDVGCADGSFLEFFEKHNMQCYGVEIGDEAYKEANKKYKVYKGDFEKIQIDQKFDLIIFRGTLQYFFNPKEYIKVAMELLNEGGYLYITSSPNSESICFKLFKEKFTLPVSVTDYYAFSESILTEYITKLKGELVCKYNFYKETPYANVEEDIKKVARAIKLQEEGKDIKFGSPAFFDNMLTLVYRKQ